MSSLESVAGIIFNANRTQVLLIKRRDVPVWVLPGGGIEEMESPENAVIREILEETGLTVKVSRVVGLYTPINRLSRKTALYECTCITGELSLSSETCGVAFFSLNALPKLIPPPYLEWIEEAYSIGPLIKRSLKSVSYASLLRNFLCHPVLVVRFFLARLGLAINSKGSNTIRKK